MSELRRWSDCPICVSYFNANRYAVIHAAASVGIEHGLTTNQALAAFIHEHHAKHLNGPEDGPPRAQNRDAVQATERADGS